MVNNIVMISYFQFEFNSQNEIKIGFIHSTFFDKSVKMLFILMSSTKMGVFPFFVMFFQVHQNDYTRVIATRF